MTIKARAGASKVLALTASAAMVTVGAVGLATAVPAAAAGGNSPQTVCAGYAGWARIDANNNTSYSGAGYAVTATGTFCTLSTICRATAFFMPSSGIRS